MSVQFYADYTALFTTDTPFDASGQTPSDISMNGEFGGSGFIITQQSPTTFTVGSPDWAADITGYVWTISPPWPLSGPQSGTVA